MLDGFGNQFQAPDNLYHHERERYALCAIIEPRLEKKPCFLHMRKQKHRSAARFHIGSTFSLLSKSEISKFWPFSVAEQLGLCRAWSETLNTFFLFLSPVARKTVDQARLDPVCACTSTLWNALNSSRGTTDMCILVVMVRMRGYSS